MNLLATLALVALGGSAPQQNAPQPPQACLVQIVSATFTRHAPQPMLDPKSMESTDVFGTLRVQVRNSTQSAIRSMTLSASFLPGKGVAPPLYKRPDPNAQKFTLTGVEPNATRTVALRVKVNADALGAIELGTVTFADGTTWQDDTAVCSYHPPASVKPAAK